MDKQRRGFRFTLISLVLLTSCSSAFSTPTSVPTEIPSPPPLQAQPVLMDAEKLARFEDYASETMQMAEIPGMSVAIVENGKLIYMNGFGVRELGKEGPVTSDTLMMIGSVSKPLTSVMIASVVDDGLMQWDTPVTSILPAFAVGDAELTQKLAMQDLVCACSGVPSKEAAAFFSNMDRAEPMLQLLGTTKPIANFGKKFIYSNTMFAAGGYIAGLAAGGPGDDLDAGYISAMQERVFGPVGMDRTTLSLEAVQSSGDFALPHGRTLERHYLPMPLSAELSVRSVKPAGGIWSTANDMSRLLLTLLEKGVTPGGERIVSRENLERIWQPGVELGEEPGNYALGWFIREFGGKRIVSHSGNSLGFSAEFALMPEAEIGIVILTNAEGAGIFTDALLYRFLELAFDLPFTEDAEFRSSLQASKKAYLDHAKKLKPGFDEKVMAPFLGTFFNPEVGEILLLAEDGKLMLYSQGLTTELSQFSGQAELMLLPYDIPLVTLPVYIFTFKKDASGKPIITLREEGLDKPYIFEKLDIP